MKKTLRNILLILIAVVIAFTIYYVLHQKDEDKNFFEQYYENKCESFGLQNYNLSAGQIVFIGDSITDLYKLDDHYPDLSLATYNRGIGGDTTEGVLKRLDVSIFDIKPSKIVLMIGTNDVGLRWDEERTLGNYREIISKIREKLPECEIYIMSIIPQNDMNYGYEESTTRILSLNPKIEKIAEEYDAVYLDIFSLLADENNYLIKEYSNDGLHLNENGLSVWTSLVKPYLA